MVANRFQTTPPLENGDRLTCQGFDWIVLDAGESIKQKANDDGIIFSRTFLGLWLAVNSLLSREIQQVLDSVEYQEFCQD